MDDSSVPLSFLKGFSPSTSIEDVLKAWDSRQEPQAKKLRVTPASTVVPAAPAPGKRLDGRVCCVIGAGQQAGDTVGNGRAVALIFAREGARLFLVDFDEASLRETARLCQELSGREDDVKVLVKAVGSEEAGKAVADGCVATFGRIDVLHNNVGIASGDAGSTEITEEVYNRIMGVNLGGFIWPTKHALQHMRRQQSGCVINISSIGSVLTLPAGGGGGMAYKASKAAMNHLTVNMAMENAKFGVRVNGILPGLMDTPLSIERRAEALAAHGKDIEVARREVREARNKQVPLHTGGAPAMGSGWDVATAALFLVSDDAKFVTGALLAVDGGQCTFMG